MNKVFKDAAAAIHDITDGNVLMLGGFGLCGIPENCIAAEQGEAHPGPLSALSGKQKSDARLAGSGHAAKEQALVLLRLRREYLQLFH